MHLCRKYTRWMISWINKMCIVHSRFFVYMMQITEKWSSSDDKTNHSHYLPSAQMNYAVTVQIIAQVPRHQYINSRKTLLLNPPYTQYPSSKLRPIQNAIWMFSNCNYHHKRIKAWLAIQPRTFSNHGIAHRSIIDVTSWLTLKW